MSYSIEEASNLVIQAGHRLVEAGLIARTWGNISARISDTQFVITPSGRGYDSLKPEDIVIVNIEDCSYEGDIKPSSEKGVHAAAYKYRSDINFIVHTHQSMATAYSTLGETLAGYGGEDFDILGDCVPCGEYAISSTKKLADKMSKAISSNLSSNGFFMRYHGVLCLGRDDAHAFRVSRKMEELCEKKVAEKIGGILTNENELTYQSTNIQFEVSESLKEKNPYSHMILLQSPAIVAISKSTKVLYPMIDDMAQIVGTKIVCVEPGDGCEDRIITALGKQNAVLIQGVGAICAADSLEDAGATGIVLDKNCLAKLYSNACGKNHKLGYWDARFQRKVYLNKYSKLK